MPSLQALVDGTDMESAKLMLQAAVAIVAVVGLLFVILRHRHDWGVRLDFQVKTTNQPPFEIEVVNLGRVALQLKTLRVRRRCEEQTAMEFPLDILITGEKRETVGVQAQLNQYVWEKQIPSKEELSTQEWHEQTEFLDIALGFDSKTGTHTTLWLPIKVIMKVHPTRGSSVARVESNG